MGGGVGIKCFLHNSLFYLFIGLSNTLQMHPLLIICSMIGNYYEMGPGQTLYFSAKEK